MTIKQLGVLNRFHVPARAMTVDLVVNVLLVLFITSNLAILYLSNIGYVLATCSRSAASCCCARTGRTGRARSGSGPAGWCVAAVPGSC